MDPDEHEIQVTVRQYPPDDVFLRTHVGKGSLGEQEVELAHNADGTPMVRIEGVGTFLLDWESMVRACSELEPAEDRFEFTDTEDE